MDYPKFVSVNDCDLELAIRKGITPMLTWTDPKKNGLPYFENHITGENRGIIIMPASARPIWRGAGWKH